MPENRDNQFDTDLIPAEPSPSVDTNPVPEVDVTAPLDAGPVREDEATAVPENGGRNPLSATVLPDTPQVVYGPPAPDDDDDVTPTLRSQIQREERAASHAEFEELLGGTETTTQKTPASEEPKPEGKKEGTTAYSVLSKSANVGYSVAKDVMMGVATGDALMQGLVGGPRDAAQAVIDGAADFTEWAVKGLGYNGTGFDFAKAKAGVQLPEVAAARTGTGAVARGMSQFLTGFMVTGGVAGAVFKGGQAVGGIAQLTRAMAQGAVTDFAFFDGHSERLSKFVEENTSLHTPFTQWLASDKGNEATNRLKNSVEGLVGGAMADGFIKAVKLVEWGKVASSMERATVWLDEKLSGKSIKTPDVPKLELNVMGDLDQGLTLKPDSAAAAAHPDFQKQLKKANKKTTGEGPEQFINYLRIDSQDDVYKLMDSMAQKASKNIEEEARGVVTHKQTKLNAEQESAFQILLNRRKGEPLNDSQTLAVRNLWVDSSEKLKQLSRLARQSPTETNVFMAAKMREIHNWVQQGVFAARREQARGLGQWRITARSPGEQASEIASIFEAMGGEGLKNGYKLAREQAEKIAKMADAGLDRSIDDFVEKSRFAKSSEAISQVYINSLLSHPATHVTNFVSNFAIGVKAIADRAMAAQISKNAATEGGVVAGEALTLAHKQMSMYYDALLAVGKNIGEGNIGQKAVDFIKGTDTSPVLGKFEQRSHTPWVKTWSDEISGAAQKTGFSEDSIAGAINIIDVGTRVPTRLLSASDNLFKSVHYRSEIHAQALRLATHEQRAGKFSVDQLKERIEFLVKNPTKEMDLAAQEQAMYLTLQAKPAATLNAIASAIQRLPYGVGRLLLPFKNTPIKIYEMALESSPLAFTLKSWREEVAKGGAARDIAFAKMANGTMLLQISMDQALSGRLTGNGPKDPRERADWQRRGIQPYSFYPKGIQSGEKGFSYNRIDPLGFLLGIGADFAEAINNAGEEVTDEEFAKAMAVAAFAISNNVLSKTYMKGPADFVAAINDPVRYAMTFAQRIAGSVVPAGVAGIARVMDPDQRAAEGFLDAIRRRIPVLSEGLPPVLNLWGEPRGYQSGYGPTFDFFSPIHVQTVNPTPIDEELRNLEYYPDKANKKIKIEGVDLELDARQYSDFVRLAGNELKDENGLGCKDYLNSVVTGVSPDSDIYYQFKEMDMEDGGKRAENFIRHTIERYRSLAKQEFFRSNSKAQVKYNEKIQNKPNARPAEMIYQ